MQRSQKQTSVLRNSLAGNVHFMCHLAGTSRPNILQLVYPTTRQNSVMRFSQTHKVAALLTRIILWVRLLRPIPIKGESVLGSPAGAAV